MLLRLYSLIGLPLSLPTAIVAQQIVVDPVPDVPASQVEVRFRTFATFPRTSETRPYARINQVEPFSARRGWMGVNDLNGPFYIVNYQGQVTEYLDLRNHFPAFVDSPGFGTGFTSFAAHPEFDQNGIFYTAHTEAGGTAPPTLPLPLEVAESLQGVITEWTASDPGSSPFSGMRREILRIDLTGTIHGFQEISFRPMIQPGHTDYGLLFVCVGEAQTLQRGPLANIGTPFSPISTILRIDPQGSNGPNGQYGIPADNPFVGQGGGLGEVLAYGFRNPHRIAWNTITGDILLTDIGESRIEELNIIVPGGNHGWPYREGAWRLFPTGSTTTLYELPDNDTGYTYPVAMYDHDDGNAIAGGFVYRGEKFSGLTGMFIASDIRTGSLWMVPADNLSAGQSTSFQEWFLRDDNGVVDPFQLVGSQNRTDMRIGQDHLGDIYILTKQDGLVRKLVTEGEPQEGYGIFEGYPAQGDWRMTGEFLGAVQVAHYPWVYLPAMSRHAYAAPSDSSSGWIYVPK